MLGDFTGDIFANDNNNAIKRELSNIAKTIHVEHWVNKARVKHNVINTIARHRRYYSLYKKSLTNKNSINKQADHDK